MKKIYLFVFGIISIILYVFFISIIAEIGSDAWRYYKRNDTEYQWKMLNEGTIEERMNAIDFLVAQKKLSIIPYLMENIDNNDYSTYKDSQRVPETISCLSTSSLRKITGELYGYTCNSDSSKTKEKIEEIIQQWRDWYKNEYPEWLEQQKQVDEK